MFGSIIKTTGSIAGSEYLICSAVSLVFGLIVALVFMYKNTFVAVENLITPRIW